MTGAENSDLYVKFGEYPTAKSYDCRQRSQDSKAGCRLTVPDGTLKAFVSVKGGHDEFWFLERIWRQLFGGLHSGTKHGESSRHGERFHLGITTHGVSPFVTIPAKTRSGTVAQGEWAHQGSVRVIPGQVLEVLMKGEGDADLYVKFGRPPTDASWDCRPHLGHSSETCRLLVPTGATAAFVSVKGQAKNPSAFSLAITAEITACLGETPVPVTKTGGGIVASRIGPRLAWVDSVQAPTPIAAVRQIDTFDGPVVLEALGASTSGVFSLTSESDVAIQNLFGPDNEALLNIQRNGRVEGVPAGPHASVNFSNGGSAEASPAGGYAPIGVCRVWSYAKQAVQAGPASDPQMPVNAVVVADLHGVGRVQYYDIDSRVIREVNLHLSDHLAPEVTDRNFDSVSGLLSGVSHPAGNRVCLIGDALARPLQVTSLPSDDPKYLGVAQPLYRILTYDKNGQLSDDIVDPLSPAPAQIHYSRDTLGRVTEIQSQVDAKQSNIVTVEYAEAGWNVSPTRIIYPTGSETHLSEFDATGGGPTLISADATGTDPFVAQIGYDSFGRIRSLARPKHILETTATIDDAGYLRETQFSSDNGRTTTTLNYDLPLSARPYRIETSKGIEFLADDQLGHPRHRRASPFSSNTPERVSCFNYSADGRLRATLYPEGNLENRYYNDEGRLVRREVGYPAQVPGWATACLDENQRKTTTHTADLQTIQSWTYDDGGFPVRVEDGSGIGVNLTTDGFGRIIQSVDGEGNLTRLGYDNRGNIAWRAAYGPTAVGYAKPQNLDAKVPLAAMIEYEYDNLNRVKKAAAWHFKGAEWVDQNKHQIVTSYAYDDLHNRISVTIDDHAPTTIDRDGMNRVVYETRPGAFAKAVYLDNGLYGDMAQLTITGPDGTTLTGKYMFNNEGQLTEVRDDKNLTLTTQYYDLFSRVHSTVVGGQKTTLEYDSFDQPTSVLQTSGSQVSKDRYVTYLWDSNGRLVSTTDANQTTTSATFDGLDRLSQILYPFNAVSQQHYVKGSTRPSDTLDPFGTTSQFQYDKAGRLSSEHVTNTNGLRYGVAGMDRLFSHTPLGDVATATVGGDPRNPANGVTVSLEYDSLGNVVKEGNSFLSVTLSHTYNGLGRSLTELTGASNSSLSIHRTFDDVGRLKKSTVNDNVVAQMYYEELAAKTVYGSGSVVSQRLYDHRGRQSGVSVMFNDKPVAGIWDSLGLDATPRMRQRLSGDGSVLVDMYEVDGADRLIGEYLTLPHEAAMDTLGPDIATDQVHSYVSNHPKGTNWRAYDVDGAGNWTKRTDAAGAATTRFFANTQPNRYQAFANDQGDVTKAFTYDPSGDTASVGTDTYVFDVLGQLAEANRGGAKTEYGYDALGRRLFERNDQNGPVYMLWDGASVAALGTDRVDANSFDVRVGGNQPDEHLAIVRSFGAGAVEFLHQGSDGSTFAATNEQGLAETYSYSGFGETTIRSNKGVVIADSTIKNRFLFQGQLYSPLMGSYYMRAREYRPDIGRFLQPDPIGLAGGENLYAFVAGRPLSYRDPSGLSGLVDGVMIAYQEIKSDGGTSLFSYPPTEPPLPPLPPEPPPPPLPPGGQVPPGPNGQLTTYTPPPTNYVETQPQPSTAASGILPNLPPAGTVRQPANGRSADSSQGQFPLRSVPFADVLLPLVPRVVDLVRRWQAANAGPPPVWFPGTDYVSFSVAVGPLNVVAVLDKTGARYISGNAINLGFLPKKLNPGRRMNIGGMPDAAQKWIGGSLMFGKIWRPKTPTEAQIQGVITGPTIVGSGCFVICGGGGWNSSGIVTEFGLGTPGFSGGASYTTLLYDPNAGR
jgi:RHS repeat-associated protein